MALVVTFCNRMEIRLVKRELRRECVLFAQVAPPDSIVLPSDFFPDQLIATHVSVDSLPSERISLFWLDFDARIHGDNSLEQ